MRTKRELLIAQQSADSDYEVGYITLQEYERRLDSIDNDRRALLKRQLEEHQMLRED